MAGPIVSDIYQSNGACSVSCAGYAFAVVQYKSCWCSNYIPADTTSTGSCNVDCPGYPDEKCGDASSGLFGYVALGKAPLGTKGAAESSSPTEAPSSSQAIPTTQATQPTLQAVSTQSLLQGFPGPPSPPTQATAFTRSASHVSRPSLPTPGSLNPILPSPISFQTLTLTQSAQNNLPNPNLVTVQDTVTIAQSNEISYVSIVCLYPALSI